MTKPAGGRMTMASSTDFPNLPTFPTPTVTLFREQLVRFRDDYGRLAEFAAFILGVDVKAMSNLDFGGWLLTQDDDMLRRAPAWLRGEALSVMAMRGDLDGGADRADSQ